MAERELLRGPQMSVVCWNGGHEHCSGVLRLWATGGDGDCWCRCHRPGVDGFVWRDNQGDLWAEDADGLMHSMETTPFPREHVEKKWGPLVPISGGTQ